MTPQEIHAECNAIAASVGIHAYVSVNITSNGFGPKSQIAMACCYPMGVGGAGKTTRATGDSFEAVLSALKEEIEAGKAERDRQTIRAMALAIIQQTMDFGECTDAALRAEFSAGDVKARGPAAIEEANKLSENRPFQIVATRGANAA